MRSMRRIQGKGFSLFGFGIILILICRLAFHVLWSKISFDARDILGLEVTSDSEQDSAKRAAKVREPYDKLLDALYELINNV
jgi:hypothetical protein